MHRSEWMVVSVQYNFTIPGRLDGLKKTWVIKDDNQKCIPHFYFDTFVDKENPRIEVTITELTREQAKMPLKDLLRDLETG